MKIKSVAFKNYKKLESESFNFNDGINEIHENNEFGKSTIIEGINDAFSLKTDLENKTTKGKDISPVIEIKFKINDNTYTLKTNSQDQSISIKGDDGTDIEKKDKIEGFFNKKQLKFFPLIVGNLLTIKERDLSTDLAKNKIKELIDSLFSIKKIDDLNKRINDIIGSKNNFVGDFAKRYNLFNEKLLNIENELEMLEKEFNEYEEDKIKLKNVYKEYNELKEKFKKLGDQKKNLSDILKIKEKQNIEKNIQEARKKLDNLTKEKENIEKELKKLESNIIQKEKLKTEFNEKLVNIKGELKLLEQYEKELKKLEEELKEIEQLKEKLENLKNSIKPYSDFKTEKLKEILAEWKSYEKIKKNAQKGMINIINANENVTINDNEYKKNAKVEFENEAYISYKDLKLKIFTSSEIGKLDEKIKDYCNKFSSKENLVKIIKCFDDKDKLEIRLKDLKIEEKQKRREELKNEIEKRKVLVEENQRLDENIKKIGSELEKLKEKENILRDKKSKVLKELGSYQEKIKVEEEKEKEIGDIEEIINNIPYGIVKKYEAKELNEIKDELTSVENELNELENKIRELEQDKAYLEAKVEKVPNKSHLESKRKEKKNLDEKINSMKRMKEILLSSKDIIKNLTEEINKEFLSDFEKKVSERFSKITKGEYSDVNFEVGSIVTDKNSFEKNWSVKRKDGTIFKVDELSDGTKAQLLLSARLALIEKLINSKAFILLDEPFAYFDPERERETREIFKSLAEEGWQIIIMSAK